MLMLYSILVLMIFIGKGKTIGDVPYTLDVVAHKFISLKSQLTSWSDQGDAEFRLKFVNEQLSPPALIVTLLCEPPYGREKDQSFSVHAKGELRMINPRNSSDFLTFEVDDYFHIGQNQGNPIPIMETEDIIRGKWYDLFEDEVNFQLFIPSLEKLPSLISVGIND